VICWNWFTGPIGEMEKPQIMRNVWDRRAVPRWPDAVNKSTSELYGEVLAPRKLRFQTTSPR